MFFSIPIVAERLALERLLHLGLSDRRGLAGSRKLADDKFQGGQHGSGIPVAISHQQMFGFRSECDGGSPQPSYGIR